MIVAIIVISIVLAVGLLVFFIGRAVRKANLPPKPENPNLPPKPKGFKGFIARLKNLVPTKRRLIQVYAALLYNANIKGFTSGKIYTGENTKYMCVPGLNCYSCPGAVGACPMGAFQNALYDSNTRAPYYILGILALFGLMLARTICGFLCPIGMCQELLYKIRTPKLKKSRVTRVLSYFKYVILVLAIAIPLIFALRDMPLPAFCKYICPAGTVGGAVMLLINPNNSTMFEQLGWQFTWKFSLAIAFIVASVFIFRVFCRFFCPLGAIYGFFNKFALIGVTVDKENCTDCGLCIAHCKMDVKHVGDHECINCGECMAVCPTKAIRWKGSTIFLRHSSVNEPMPEEKPLVLTEGEVKIGGAAADSIAVTANAAQETAATAVATEATETPIEQSTEKPIENTKTKTKRGKAFWLELAAWITALAVLVFALVYYNFIYKEYEYVAPPPSGDDPTEIIGYNVGDTAPNFTLDIYGEDGTFNLYDNRGKIVVVNFWATWCSGCVEEMPYFIELAENHPEVSIVAIHGSGDTKAGVQKFIDKNWGNTSVTFVQDKLNGAKCQTYLSLGGADTWPMTVIVGADGKILYNKAVSFKNYAQLETLVTGFIQNQDQAE